MNTNPDSPLAPKTSLAMRLFRLAFKALLVSVALILLVWLGWIILPWIALPPIIEPRVRELGRVANWGRDTIVVVTVVAVVAAVFCFRRIFTKNPRQHWTAVAALAALVVTYFGFHAWLSRDHLYTPSGEPLFYWGLTPGGTIYKQAEPGTNPYTMKPLAPASCEYLALIGSRLREPLQPVDPAIHDWFDVNTGWPLLWFIRNPQGQLEFYARPAIHPRYQVELQEVTVELRRHWEQEQARIAAEAAARAAQELEEKRKQDAARAAEQERLLEIERLRLATAQQEAEIARREKEAATARAREEQARRESEEKAAQARRAEEEKAAKAKRDEEATKRYLLALAERERQEQEATAQNRRQAILDRRAREATAPVAELDWLAPADMLRQVCPKLNAESFQTNIFMDEYAGRRLRYSGRVARLDRSKSLATFEPVPVGDILLVIQATLQPETARLLRAHRLANVAGTVAAFRFAPGVTNINGVRGRVCCLEFGNVTACAFEAASSPTRSAARTTGSPDPVFVPMSNFQGNGPINAAVGFTFHNSVRLAFSPLRLLGKPAKPCREQPRILVTPATPYPTSPPIRPAPGLPFVSMAPPSPHPAIRPQAMPHLAAHFPAGAYPTQRPPARSRQTPAHR